MVTVIPINEKGEQIGPEQHFSDDKFARLKTIKPFRWREVKPEPKNIVELMSKADKKAAGKSSVPSSKEEAKGKTNSKNK